MGVLFWARYPCRRMHWRRYMQVYSTMEGMAKQRHSQQFEDADEPAPAPGYGGVDV